MSAVEFKDVVKIYGKGEGKQVAVDHVSFTIEKGEFVVILGQSGAGKSTVLNMLGGMDIPTEGKVIVDGKEISSYNDRQLSEYRADKIGFIFQFYNLLPGLTAYENVALVKNIKKSALSPDEMLERVGLADQKNKFPTQMSGGQQQRVSIARALVKNPRVILADEPTAALDYQTSIEVLQVVEDIVRNKKKTVCMITHNPEIAKMADRVVKLRAGLVSSVRVNMEPVKAVELSW